MNIYNKIKNYIFPTKIQQQDPRELIDDAIFNLKLVSENLVNLYNNKNLEVQNLQQEAKHQILQNNNKSALQILQRRKLHQNELSSLNNQILTVQKQISQIKTYQIQKETLKHLESSNVKIDLDIILQCKDVQNQISENEYILDQCNEVFVSNQDDVQDEIEKLREEMRQEQHEDSQVEVISIVSGGNLEEENNVEQLLQ